MRLLVVFIPVCLNWSKSLTVHVRCFNLSINLWHQTSFRKILPWHILFCRWSQRIFVQRISRWISVHVWLTSHMHFLASSDSIAGSSCWCLTLTLRSNVQGSVQRRAGDTQQALQTGLSIPFLTPLPQPQERKMEIRVKHK